MEISKLKTRGIQCKSKKSTFIINPEVSEGKINSEALNADFILLGNAPEFEQEKFNDDHRIFSWPGEFEVNGVAFHARPVNGYNLEEKSNLLFVIYTEEMKVGILPKLEKELSEQAVEAIGDLNLLIFPASGDEKVWQKTIEAVEPDAILPLEDADSFSLDSFLAKFGLTAPESSEKITIKSKSELSSMDKMNVLLLA